jgi:small subunit ribosomal protein S6
MLRDYETVFVLHPRLDDKQVEEEIQRVQDLIVQNGGEIINVERWGRKRMAYEIRKVREGIYTLIQFSSEPHVIQELDRRYKLNENVLRHLTVLAHPSAIRAAREKAARQRAAEEAKAAEPAAKDEGAEGKEAGAEGSPKAPPPPAPPSEPPESSEG